MTTAAGEATGPTVTHNVHLRIPNVFRLQSNSRVGVQLYILIDVDVTYEFACVSSEFMQSVSLLYYCNKCVHVLRQIFKVCVQNIETSATDSLAQPLYVVIETDNLWCVATGHNAANLA